MGDRSPSAETLHPSSGGRLSRRKIRYIIDPINKGKFKSTSTFSQNLPFESRTQQWSLEQEICTNLSTASLGVSEGNVEYPYKNKYVVMVTTMTHFAL